ncbi:MAG: DUF4147 domain-containing protein, partial [Candidatus Adiutricales bacterium]
MSPAKEINSKLKSDTMAIFNQALAAADPNRAIKEAVSLEDNAIRIRRGNKVLKTIRFDQINRIFVVGAGKATAAMARALEEILGDKISRGIISVKKGHDLDLKYTTVRQAAHPVPDSAGVKAAGQIKALIEEATSKDLIFSLISGGGSAL